MNFAADWVAKKISSDYQKFSRTGLGISTYIAGYGGNLVNGPLAAALTYYNHGHFDQTAATAAAGQLSGLDDLTKHHNYVGNVLNLADCFK